MAIALNDPIVRMNSLQDLIDQVIELNRFVDPFGIEMANAANIANLSSMINPTTRTTSERSALDRTRGNGRVLEVPRGVTDRGALGPRTTPPIVTEPTAPFRGGFITPLPGMPVEIGGVFPRPNLPVRDNSVPQMDTFVRDLAARMLKPRSFGAIR